MYMKMLGAVLIVACCGGYGILLAATHRREVKLLRQLLNVLGVMQSELEYRLTPVIQLCRLCGEDAGELRSVFLTVADKLEKQEAADPATAMTLALQQEKCLPPIAASILRNLGQTLGRFDLQGQIRGFSQCAKDCGYKLNELETNQQQRLRSYQTLGFCAGAALAILLF